jgi:hypothetical protein
MRTAVLVAALARRLAPLFGLCVTTAVLPSTTWASTTTWTNPDGGAWSDPANWSNGVPQSGDAVELHGLDGDGYTITVNGAVVCDSLEVTSPTGTGPVRLEGGSVGVTGWTVVGGSVSAGTLVLDGTSLSSLFVDIGVDGSGTLELRNDGAIGAALARIGQSGEGRLTVGLETKVLGYMWQLGSGAHLQITVAPTTDTPIDVQDFTRGGTFEVLVTPDFGIPSSGNTLIRTDFGIGGAFSAVALPTIDGYQLPLTTGTKVMLIPAFDPILGAEILFPNLPPVVGFDSDLWIEESRYSGVMTYSCWGSLCDYEWTVVDGEAVFNGDVLHVLGPGPITIEAARDSYGMLTTASITIEALAESAFLYRRLAIDPNGNSPGNTVEWSPRGPRASEDGRFTVFAHRSVLGMGPTCDPHPTQPDVLVHDASTGVVECVSANVPTAPSANPDISGDGRRIVFTNGSGSSSQVWLHDRWTGLTTRISQSPDGEPGNAQSRWPCLSRDGSIVIFTSKATNLGAEAQPDVEQVYLYDVESGQLSLLSRTNSGEAGTGNSNEPSVSVDGRLVAFATSAPNLLQGAENQHIVLLDRVAGTSELIDRATNGTLGNGSAYLPVLSACGRFVLFSSQASNLDANDPEIFQDVFLRDRLSAITTWVSPNFPTSPTPSGYAGTALTDDGSSVVYIGSVPDGGFTTFHLMRRWIDTGECEWVSATPWNEAGHVAGSLTPFTANDSQLLFFGPQFNIVPYETSWSYQPLARLYAPRPPADLNGDGLVNAGDLALLLAAWGTGDSAADIDLDGAVGAGDLAILLAAWSV